MNVKKLQKLAIAKHNHLVKHNQDVHKILTQLNQQVKELQQSMGDFSDLQAKQTMQQLINDVNAKKKQILHYKKHFNDEKYVVITNWSENDLYDSNAQLISNQNMASWRHIGCKVYGKAGPDPNAQNSAENLGYFAQFNYPINIIKDPNTFFFTTNELKHLYDSIASHNPKLKNILVKIAKAGTVKVHTFKTMFGLSDRQLRAKIQKAKFNAQNSMPNPSISKLERFYQWELKQRKSISPESDLTEYDSDTSDESDFNTGLRWYKETGVSDSDPSHYDDDNLDGWWLNSDYDAGEEYDDPYYSQWSDRDDYGMDSDSDDYRMDSDKASDSPSDTE